ncbi:MAG: spermidine synthase, partial [Chloroflexi bacterium]|nr:spermidine synthase [Chloroflexota bacterium]
HLYHEALVHPAMLMHSNPRTVFIGGGGEGGTLREVLAHRSVERVVMLDLDQEVVELCRRFLPHHHQGSFDDPRVELLFQDARQYLEESRESFDVLIMDLVDPLEGGTAYRLYTEEFYRIVKSRMGAGGIMVTQSGPAGLLSFDECFTTIYKTLASIFASTVPSQVHVPAFATLWGIILASESKLPTLTDEQVDGLVAERINKELRFYDGESHRNMFAMPRYVRQGIQQESRINRDATPVFMI